MKNIYHAHFTVADIGDTSIGAMAKHSLNVKTAASIIRGKETAIKLETEHRQYFDYMITKYYWHIGGTIDDIIKDMMSDIENIIGNGVEITRWKLEKDIDVIDDITNECKYIEIHQELILKEDRLSVVKNIASKLGWHPSNNVRAKLDDGMVRQFVNKRFSNTHAAVDLESEISKLHAAIHGEMIIYNPRIEQVIIDSNLAHDEWWGHITAHDNIKCTTEAV